jgi:hypothetical protein
MFWVNLLYATSTIPLSTRTEQNLKQICNNWKVINKGVKGGEGREESVCAKRNRKYSFLLSYKKVAKKIMAEKKERK